MKTNAEGSVYFSEPQMFFADTMIGMDFSVSKTNAAMMMDEQFCPMMLMRWENPFDFCPPSVNFEKWIESEVQYERKNVPLQKHVMLVAGKGMLRALYVVAMASTPSKLQSILEENGFDTEGIFE